MSDTLPKDVPGPVALHYTERPGPSGRSSAGPISVWLTAGGIGAALSAMLPDVQRVQEGWFVCASISACLATAGAVMAVVALAKWRRRGPWAMPALTLNACYWAALVWLARP